MVRLFAEGKDMGDSGKPRQDKPAQVAWALRGRARIWHRDRSQGRRQPRV